MPQRQPEERTLKTLERIFSKAGLGSRTDARGWIQAGRVRVNGKSVRDPDFWVDPQRDRVTLDGKPVKAIEKVYILLHKPTGYLTTWRDPDGRPTVYELTAAVGTWIVPVGRLDLDTSGLLLMTNDTDFAERVCSPDHLVPKTYLVTVSALLSDAQIEQLRHGVELRDGPTRPAKVERIGNIAGHTRLEMSITEGRNRQVRRMIEAIGAEVLQLARVAIGQISIGDLASGAWRRLSPAEVTALGGKRPVKPIPTTNTSAGQRKRTPGSRAYRSRY